LSSSKESSGLTARGTDSWGGWVPTYGHIKETQIAGRWLAAARERSGGRGTEEETTRKKSSKGGLLLNLVKHQHPTATKCGPCPLWIAYSSTLW
jgi:hypothetical protein